jgi:16S rRNA (cytosine967-C5)-methyltransferase
VRGDIPEWLAPRLEAAFGDRAAEEGAGLAGRAPLDLRVNTLKTGRDQVARALEKYGARPTALSPVGLRIALAEGPARPPDVEAHALHGRGRFEVQDEGSQVAALMAGARPGMQVVDYCAGAGGKTLALAATMENRGQIHAHDSEARRLRPIFERLRRAGARNVQVLSGEEGLEALTARSDLVLVDAPCTGSGVWRRRPDAKWRLKPEALEERRREQARILARAAPLVRPGGRLVYVTCSVLPAENSEQIAGFVAEHPDFTLIPWDKVWGETLGTDPPASAADGDGLLLTPARHATDGFFIAVLGRA